MQIDFGLPHQIPQLAKLWHTAFGDTQEVIDGFFRTAYAPSRCRCVTADGQVAAALYWFDLRCRDQKMAYIYAVATAPEHRGQGLCRRLMADTHAHLTQQGYRGVLLVPEDPGLRRMYGSFGYQPGTTLREFTASAGDIPADIQVLSRDAFACRRRELLPPDGLLQEGENLTYLETAFRFYAGPGFLAVLHQDGDRVFCPEILGDPAAAPGLLRALGAKTGIFHCPGQGMDFAMFLPLHPEAVRPRYFAFAFD